MAYFPRSARDESTTFLRILGQLAVQAEFQLRYVAEAAGGRGKRLNLKWTLVGWTRRTVRRHSHSPVSQLHKKPGGLCLKEMISVELMPAVAEGVGWA